jgi:excinuclease UvrABC nuclease subunit
MHEHVHELRAQARALPELPGVYFWIDGLDRILYIGKAVNLRARVTSYFSNARRDGRTRDLIGCARSLRFEVTTTELDALFRESALIKRHQPPYNRLLRTSRRLYYLKLDRDTPDPYLQIVREIEPDGADYFGPFHTATVIRETVAFLHGVLPLRKCAAQRPRCRPCMYHQMGTCAAPLLDEEHRQQHKEAIAHLNDLLDGRHDRVVQWLENKRDRLSDSLMFERAAEIQSRLDTLREMLDRQVVLEAAVRCRHVLILDRGRRGDAPRILLVARGRVLSTRDVQDMDVDGVQAWVRAHAALARTIREEQSELDAASVLEGWIRYRRDAVRWTSVPPELSSPELRERVAYVLEGSATGQPIPV